MIRNQSKSKLEGKHEEPEQDLEEHSVNRRMVFNFSKDRQDAKKFAIRKKREHMRKLKDEKSNINPTQITYR